MEGTRPETDFFLLTKESSSDTTTPIGEVLVLGTIHKNKADTQWLQGKELALQGFLY